MANKTNRAKSAKTETAKRVNNRANSAKTETAVEVIPVIDAVEVQIESDAAAEKAAETTTVVEDVEVETVDTQATAAAALPVAANTDNGKVSSKDVLKAAGNLRAAVKEERRGANCTIRLIAERAASGDAAAVDVLCALCDIPRSALYSLNIDTIRAAVNAYYPYYTEKENRRISVKPVGVWYSTADEGESIETAAKRVKRGYRAVAVVDYLDQLILAAKSRAKGLQPRRVDADAIYGENKLSTVSLGITAAEIDEAKARKSYSPYAANVWHKDRNGFYI